ncbi:monocarboxylate transporter 12-like [Diabrotica undecimpunctata]|uniref:monocarboxylate transporter 12-like n=1 Tax=Diabrotica undecimpunctata TaxID=50387 RepID=UPI003B64241B
METVLVDNGATSKKDRPQRSTSITSRLSQQLKKNQPFIPDGGYGWIVVIATFLIYAIAEGISFVFGLLYVEFLHEFKGSKSATSWIGSLFVALPLVSGPICSALVDRYGCKKMTIIGSVITALGFVLSSYVKSLGVLYITYGVIGGLARGVCYVTVVVAVAFWFEKKRSVALGISASGTGFGTIIFSPFTNFLLFEFGWRGTLLILGGCLANMCVCGALMIDPQWVIDEELEKKREAKRKVKNVEMREMHSLLPNDVENHVDNIQALPNGESSTVEVVKPEKGKKWYDGLLVMVKAFASFSLFLDLHFLLLALTTLLAGTWFLIPYFYLADHMLESGYDEDQASVAVSVIGFMNIIGMVLLGWIGDRWHVAKTFSISLVLCGVSIWGIMFFTSNYILLIGCSASFGFFFSSCFSLTPSLLGELVSLDDFTMGYGLILLCEGSGHLIGPPLAGYISDVTKSWAQSFYQSGLWIIVAGLLVGSVAFTNNRKIRFPCCNH